MSKVVLPFESCASNPVIRHEDMANAIKFFILDRIKILKLQVQILESTLEIENRVMCIRCS